MGLAYWYMAAWIAGGVVLALLALLRTSYRPIALALALMGFGAAGFAARMVGYFAWQTTLPSALAGSLLLGVIGYGIERLR